MHRMRFTTLTCIALLAAALGPIHPVAAHNSFACPGGYFLNVATGGPDDDVPDVHDVTTLTIAPVPAGLAGLDVTAYAYLRGQVKGEAFKVPAWHDFVEGASEFHIYVEAGAVLVQVLVHDCTMRTTGGDVVAASSCSATHCVAE